MKHQSSSITYRDADSVFFSKWTAHRVMEDLWIGGFRDSMNLNELKKLQISHVLTIALGVEPRFPEEFEYMVVKAQDKNDQDLLSYLPVIHEFIDRARENGTIFIHCMEGQSRSAMVVTSYLMKESRINVHEAFEFLKKIRDRVKPRKAFIDQLEVYHYFSGNFQNVQLQNITSRWPNKAQISVWANGKTSYLPQPPWIEENPLREWWDYTVHVYMDFYNRYLRFYTKE
jgi:protein-tyrosine phosphatase